MLFTCQQFDTVNSRRRSTSRCTAGQARRIMCVHTRVNSFSISIHMCDLAKPRKLLLPSCTVPCCKQHTNLHTVNDTRKPTHRRKHTPKAKARESTPCDVILGTKYVTESKKVLYDQVIGVIQDKTPFTRKHSVWYHNTLVETPTTYTVFLWENVSCETS